MHKREVYNWWDLLSDIGGIYELVVAFCGFILYTISKHSFLTSAIKNMFFVNTKDPELIKYEIQNEDSEENLKMFNMSQRSKDRLKQIKVQTGMEISRLEKFESKEQAFLVAHKRLSLSW